MKKLSLAVLVISGLTSGMAFADNQSVSIGYAQSDVQDFKNIRGVNLQYHYEFDSPFSVVGSFTYMSGSEDRHYYVDSDAVNTNIDVKYYSLLVGPAYRINDYVSLYALGGAARTKADADVKWLNAGSNDIMRASESYKSTSFAYGAGVIINPIENLTVNVGYEGTTADLDDNYSINGFNIGIGYRF